MKAIKLLSVLLLVITFSTSKASYQAFSFPQQCTSWGTMFAVQEDKFPMLPLVSGYTNFDVQNYIQLSVDWSDNNYHVQYAYDVKVQVKTWDVALNTQTTIYTMTVEYDPNANPGVSYQDRDVIKFKDAHRIEVTVLNVYDRLNNGNPVAIPLTGVTNLELKAFIGITRVYDFNHLSTVCPSSVTPLDHNSNGSFDELEINWPLLSGAEEYEIEWTYVDDYNADYTLMNPATIQYNFENNSSRVTVPAELSNQYFISLIYERGFLLFRIRGVGLSQTDPNHKIFGAWSAPDAGTGLSPSGCVVPFYYHLVGYNDNINWQFSSNFTENGKKKEIIGYYDGGLKNRQKVTVVSADHTAVIAETVYDFQGRKAIEILPVPVQTPALDYYPDFNMSTVTGKTYSWEDFDMDQGGGCTTQTGPLSDGSGAANYYSANNPDQSDEKAFIPKSNGFPFSQTEYTPDNTGRVRRQGGMGSSHQLGQVPLDDKSTKYYYGQPYQVELDRLFGNEVGYASRYKKNMMIDANGQISISYQDLSGKTIATGLTGEDPSNVEALRKYNGGQSTVIHEEALDTLTEDLFKKDADGNSNVNVPNLEFDALEFRTTFLVSEPGDHKFTYTASPVEFTDQCDVSLCYDCAYDLVIEVTDECGMPIHQIVQSLAPGSIDNTCESETYSVQSFTLDLDIGNYNLTKRLEVNEATYLAYLNDYLSSNNSCYPDLAQLILDEKDSLDYTGCEVTCEECAEALGSMDEFVAKGHGTEEDWQEEYELCLKACSGVSLCETVNKLMLTDVSPGGQYAQYYDEKGVKVDPSKYPLSVLNSDNQLSVSNAYWRYPVSKNGGASSYYLPDGTESWIELHRGTDGTWLPESNTIFVDNGKHYTRPQHLVYVQDFIQQWKSSWANSLVYYHPEFCYSEWCLENTMTPVEAYGMSSDEFDDFIHNIETMADAVSENLTINTYPILEYDPYFQNPTGDPTIAARKADMITKLSTGYQAYTGYTAKEFAALANNCGSYYGPSLTPSCTTWVASSHPLADATWTTYMTIYLSLKQEIQKDLADQWVIDNNRIGFNECIGNKGYEPFHSNLFDMTKSYPTMPFGKILFSSEPCGESNYRMYQNKVARFDIKVATIGGKDHSEEYNRSYFNGACPNALDFEGLVNEIIDGNQASMGSNFSADLSSYRYFTPALLEEIQGSLTPINTYSWNSAVSGQTHTVTITNGSYTANVTMVLSAGSWTDVDFVDGIKYLTTVPGSMPTRYTYRMTAGFYDDSNPDKDTITYATITGEIDIDIANCTFEDECEPTDYSRSLTSLLNALVANQQEQTTGLALSPTYDGFTNRFITNYLGNPASLSYSYNGGTTNATIYETGNATNQIVIDFPGGFNFSNVDRFTKVSVDTSKVANGLILTYVNGSTETDVAVTVSTGVTSHCYDPTLQTCNDIRFDVTRDFEVLLEEWIESSPTMDVDLNTTNNFTSLLEAYIGSGDVILKAPTYTNNKNTMETTIQVLTPGTSTIETECELRIYRKLHSEGANNPIPLDEISDIGNLKVDMKNIYMTDAHHFTILARFDGKNNFEEELYGYISCLPLFDCDTCEISYFPPSGGGPCPDYDLYESEMIAYGQTPIPYDSTFPCGCIRSYLKYVRLYTAHSDPMLTLNSAIPDLNGPLLDIFIFSNLPYNCEVIFQDCDTSTSQNLAEVEIARQAYNMLAIGNNWDTLPPVIGGKCECLAKYIVYLDYWTNLHMAIVPPVAGLIAYEAMTYDEFRDNGCSPQPCFEEYKFYYNEVMNQGGAPALYSDTVEQCGCWKKYAQQVDLTIAHDGEEINRWCTATQYTSPGKYSNVDFSKPLGPRRIPYDPNVAIASKKRTFSFCENPGPEIYFVKQIDDCSLWLDLVAEHNARNRFEQLIAKMTEEFHDGYMEKCMSIVEDFSLEYPNRDYHFTLYYYDQAGNLVRTVPPAGVEVEDDPTAFTQIKKDRTYGTRVYYTKHRLSSVYEFNSLNQLTRQHVPDNETMNKWMVSSNPSGLPSGLETKDLHFSSPSDGILLGVLNGETHVYRTSNGGRQWVRNSYLRAGAINDMMFYDANVGYAVGENGLLLKTTDAGDNWKIILTGSTFNSSNLIGIVVDDGNALSKEGIIISDNNKSWSFTDNGSLNISGLTNLSAGVFTDIKFDGTNAYATVADNATGKGYVYESSLSSPAWTDFNFNTKTRSTGLLQADWISPSTAFVVGEDGVLLKTTNSGSSFEHIATGLTTNLEHVYFKDANTGVALGANGTIYKTTNGGFTWAEMSSTGFYNGIHFYDQTNGLGYGVGSNGIVALIDVSETYVQRLQIKPTLTEHLSCIYMESGGTTGLIGSMTGKIYRVDVSGAGNMTINDMGTTGFKVREAYLNGNVGVVLNDNNDLIRLDISTTSTGYSAVQTPLAPGQKSFDFYNTSLWVLSENVPGTSYDINEYSATNPTSPLSVQPISVSNDLNFVAYDNTGAALVAGTNGELHDATSGWLDQSDNIHPTELNAIDIQGSDIVVGGRDGRIYLSSNGGSNFQLKSSSNRGNVKDISLESTGNIGLATTDQNTFIKINNGSLSTVTFTSSVEAVYMANTTDAYMTSDEMVYSSTDGGLSWRTESYGLDKRQGLTLYGKGSDVYLMGENSVLGRKTSSWSNLYVTCDALNAIDLKDNSGLIVGTSGLNFNTTNGGKYWDLNPLASENLNAVKVFSASSAYYLGDNGLAESADLAYSTPSSLGFVTTDNFVAFSMNEYGLELLATEGQVYARPSGGSWSGQLTSPDPVQPIRDITVRGDYAYFVGDNDMVYYNNDVNNNPSNFIEISSSNLPSGVNTSYTKVVQASQKYAYAVGDGGIVIKTTSGGAKWSQKESDANGTNTSENLTSIKVLSREDVVFGGTDGYYARVNDQSDFTTSMFWYDRLGRMVVSQNSKQFNKSPIAYSYTLYDEIGRIVEVGEKANNTPVESTVLTNQIDDTELSNWLTTGANSTRTEITQTFYDVQSIASVSEITQTNLRKRVASISYEEVYDANNQTYDYATHYAYDIHGGVDHILHEIPELASINQEYKHVYYEFDLVSSNVTKVKYNPGEKDAFYHRYTYDADNRILSAETSTDDLIWDEDATYKYYQHGPVSRTEIGDIKVQGLDYVYTIQGWLKGVNSNTMKRTRDPGRDGDATLGGNPYAKVGGDVFGFSLGYYDAPIGRDYESIATFGATDYFLADPSSSDLLNDRFDFYNGNISHMVTVLPDVAQYNAPGHVISESVLGNAYRYDQLNRIAHSRSYTNVDVTNNVWELGTQPTPTQYEADFTYDQNGNLLTLSRNNAAGTLMDNLTYKYDLDNDGNIVSNKLYNVNDTSISAASTNDLEDQGAFDAVNLHKNNYYYDELGNLIKDSSELIANITWTVYGKVKEVIRDNGVIHQKPDLEFGYDGGGNRIVKIVKPRDVNGNLVPQASWEYTYYLHDVAGNIMATYSKSDQGFSWNEAHIYGNARIGIVRKGKLLTESDCDVSFDLDTIDLYNPGDQPFSDEVIKAINDAGLGAFQGNLQALFETRIFDAKNQIGDPAIFEAWMQGFASYLCVFKCYNLANSIDFMANIDPIIHLDMNESLDPMHVNTNDINSVMTFWANRAAAMETSLNNLYGPCVPEEDRIVRNLGDKRYELTNHLGNVLVVVTDKKAAVETSPGSGLVKHYEAEMTSITDYYPFGMMIDNRSYTVAAKDYRFGFNGHERDDELNGSGNHYSFGDFGYSPRIGRRFNIDPVEITGISGYVVLRNNPFWYKDPTGESPISIFAKAVAKAGLKKAAKEYVERQIKKRLKRYMSKKWAKQLGEDALNFVDKATATAWYDYAIELIPIAGDAYGAAKLGKQGYTVWKGLEKFEAIAKSAEYIIKKQWKRLDMAKGLKGKGTDELARYTKKLNNQGSHLKEDDLGGAIKELYGLKSGVKANGTPYQHLKEVKESMDGMRKTLNNLNNDIAKGKFSGDALEAARGTWRAAKSQHDELVRAYNSAVKQSNKMVDIKIN